MNLQLSKISTIEGKIVLVTGLHVGSGNDIMHIGGIDNPVIKHPLTQMPYIPGSSLKGKMRSLLEWRAGLVGQTKGKPVAMSHLGHLAGEKKTQAEKILKLFGASGDSNGDTSIGPTRLSFWDAMLEEDFVKKANELGVPITEEKTENTIDRISVTAKDPRHTERVPAEASFRFKLIFKHLMDSDEQQLLPMLKSGLKLLEIEGLGGSGSRGYGKIRFENLTMDGQPIDDFEQLDPFKE